MPVILEEESWPQWLGEADVTGEELTAMMKPFPAERMRAHPISTPVNSVRFYDEAILAPMSQAVPR
jgi:putative SOS response-associated peptidase YedK